MLAVMFLWTLTACGQATNTWREPAMGVNAYIGEPEGVSAYLWTDHSCYQPGEPVVVRMWLENGTNEAARIWSETDPVLSLWLCPAFTDGSGCRILETEEPLKQEVVLEPGERYVIESTIRRPTEHLEYEVWGSYSNKGVEGYNRALIRRYPDCGSSSPSDRADRRFASATTEIQPALGSIGIPGAAAPSTISLQPESPGTAAAERSKSFRRPTPN